MGTGGAAYRLEDFEGLVFATARLNADRVGMDVEDLAQELRVRVWRANEAFTPEKVRSSDPERRRTARQRFVFSALQNKIKDYRRDAARRAAHDIGFVPLDTTDPGDAPGARIVDHEDVYRRVDEGLFTIPAGVTEPEVHVLLMLMMDFTRAEVAVRLGVAAMEVDRHVAALREKFADWQPTQPNDCSRTVRVVDAARRLTYC